MAVNAYRCDEAASRLLMESSLTGAQYASSHHVTKLPVWLVISISQLLKIVRCYVWVCNR